VTIDAFKKLVNKQGADLFREMPWRAAEPDGGFDAYKILVSEMMLQQTQVSRVIPKFNSFVSLFPTIHDLAAAPLADVLRAWSGLGYNRRAQYLHQAAIRLADRPLPWTYDDLIACNGVGPNTARAVLVYAYNSPELFIETNIRTVYIHYFFADITEVNDESVIKLLKKTLNKQNPRQWYWALMDIGARIKSTTGNVAAKSSAYKKQSAFQGSLRQVRGAILKELLDGPKSGAYFSAKKDGRFVGVLATLTKEGLIHKKSHTYYLGLPL